MNDIYYQPVPKDREYEYKRILEILAAYWLEEPNEDRVKVTLEFRKGKEFQEKIIHWSSGKPMPNEPERKRKTKIINSIELFNMSPLELIIYEKQKRHEFFGFSDDPNKQEFGDWDKEFLIKQGAIGKESLNE